MSSNPAPPVSARPAISSEDLATCRRFIHALAGSNAVAALAEAHPSIELHTPRAVLRGADGLRTLLAGDGLDHLDRTIVVDHVAPAGPRAIARGVMELRWRDTGELADRAPVGALLDVRDGRVVRWQPTLDGA